VSRSFKKAACLVCLSVVGINWSHRAVAQQRTIEVSWVEVHDEISPRHVVSRHSRALKFDLENDNTIVTSSRTFHNDEEQITRNGTGLTRWRFNGSNTLIREQVAPGYIRRVVVQIDGSGLSCRARISFSPGAGRLYQMNRNLDGSGEELFLRSVGAENVACKVIGRAGV
jgi:hypothetical protein